MFCKTEIDRSFVQRVPTDRHHGKLVMAILLIADCFGQQVVEAGVKTTGQAAFLRASG
jgi:EAL domain-containing protein (putative c-di-GMP-specific phosphodiesterase class I)